MFFLTVLVLSFNSCKKIDKLTQFDLDYDESITIPSVLGINLPFNIYSPDIKTNTESIFEINNTKKDLVEQVNILKLVLKHRSPEKGDFDFLKGITIFISAEGVDEIKVAWKDNIPDDIGKTLELELTDANLKEYIKKDEFMLRVETITDKIILSDQDVDIQTSFFVDAKILGV